MGDLRTNFLTPETGFVIGFGSALNVAGNYYRFNTSPTAAEADARALRSDWVMVGQDLAASIDKADTEPACHETK